MSTLEKIRKRSAILGGFSIVLVILFVLGDLGRSSTSQKIPAVMEVQGEEVPYGLYEGFKSQFKELLSMYYPEASFAEQESKKMAFSQLLETVLVKQKMQKIGLSISKDEQEEILFGEQMPADFARFLGIEPATPDSVKNEILDYVRKVDAGALSGANYAEVNQKWRQEKTKVLDKIATQKWQNLVNQALFVNALEVADFQKNSQQKVDFQFVFLPYNSQLSAVNEEEVKNYYKKISSEEKYQNKNPKIAFEYVVFPIVASSEDSMVLWNQMQELKTQWQELNNDTSFITLHHNKRFLDIQDFYPNLLGNNAKADENQIRNAKVGTIFGPYWEGTTAKLAKVKINGPVQERKVAHILLRINDNKSLEAIAAAQSKADSLKNLIKNKTDFEAIAMQFSEDPSNKEKGGDLGWVSKGQMVPAFEEAVFNSKMGTLTTVVSEFGVHILRVDSLRTEKKLKLAVIEKKLESSWQTEAAVYQNTIDFITAANAGDFRQIAIERNLMLQSSNDFNLDGEDNSALVGVENQDALRSFLYKNAKNSGQISEPLQDGISAFIVAKIAQMIPVGAKPYDFVASELTLETQKQMAFEKIKAKNLTSLEEVATQFNVAIGTLQNLDLNLQTLPEIGIEPAVLGAAFADKNEMLGPILGNRGIYFIQKTNSYNSQNTVDAAYAKASIKNQYNNIFESGSYFAFLRKNTPFLDKRWE